MTFTSRKWLFGSRKSAPSKRAGKLSRLLLITGVLVLVCRIEAPSQNKPTTTSTSKEKIRDSTIGKQAYSANCAGCHGLDGKGGERAPDIVTRPQVRQLSDEAILQVLLKGVPNTSMPSFRFLDLKTRKSLVAHLRIMQGATAVAMLPGDPRRGKEIFFNKGGCANCHMIVRQGGFFASDLTGYAQGRSPELVRDAIISPNRDLDPRRRTVVAKLTDGTLVEGIARNEDNFSLQIATPDGSFHLLSKAALASLTYSDQSPMPSDFATKLSSSELDDLVNFLFSSTQETSNRKAEDEQEED